MTTLTLQEPKLIKSLEYIATAQNTTAGELLSVSVSEFLNKMARQKIHIESKAFKAMHADLITKHLGQYVAVHNGQVVDYDEDARALYLRIQKQYGYIAVLIRQVTDKAEQELVFRSPRLTREQP